MTKNVSLLWHTPNPEYQVAVAMRRCTSIDNIEYIQKDLWEAGPQEWARMIKIAHRDKSYDVFEHVVFEFAIDKISLVAALQLFRHRMVVRDLSPDQLSERFSPVVSNPDYVVPPSFNDCSECRDKYLQLAIDAEKVCRDIRNHGHPKQDARFAMIEGTASKLVLTLNATALLHIADMRIDKKAQWEIRDIVVEMVELAASVTPTIFDGIGKDI